MPIYTGTGVLGDRDFYMEEAEGVYVNPDNENEWSSRPYPSQAKFIRTKTEVLDYMSGKYTLQDVYNQILDKKCPLSKRCRDFVLDHFNEDGTFKYEEND